MSVSASSKEALSNWRSVAVLKSDHFSTVERGFWRGPNGEEEAVLRRFDVVPVWIKPVAYHFGRREVQSLKKLNGLAGPRLLAYGPGYLVRSWIDGLPLHMAKPEGENKFFAAAKKMMFRMHRSGVVHNDLAKEQNWLRDGNGMPRLTDFQLAHTSEKRSRLFRIAAHEDLRHLLKHKRKYAPDFLTAREKKILATKSVPARIWMATGKKVYIFVTRKIFGYMDREGSGADYAIDGPRIAARLQAYPGVTGSAIVSYPTPRGARLYAFVETEQPVKERELREHISRSPEGLPDPSLIQIAPRLPRNKHGEVREEVLRLVALNQVDLIDGIALDADAKLAADELIAGRLNRTDRRLREG